MKVEINEIVDDSIVARNFVETWKIINELLVSFSKATQLPISIMLEGKIIFTSPIESLPTFCQQLLNNNQTSQLCYLDSINRSKEKFEKKKRNKRVQLCHAGMVNAKREIETGVGTLTILFGFKPAFNDEARKRRKLVIEKLAKISADSVTKIENEINENDYSVSNQPDERNMDSYFLEKNFFEEHDITLINSITRILELLITVTVEIRSLTINMAHELVVLFLGINLMSQETSDTLEEIQEAKANNENIAETIEFQKYMDSETKLGLYVVRNYLSQASEYRYSQVVKPHFEKLNLKPIITDMTEIYKWRANEKDLSIISEIETLPDIWGDKMELRRALHNIFTNAVKYSYHSIENHPRNIRVYSRIPYDPGFKSSRFAILFENYGLGLEEEELKKAFLPGFRGNQALKEVAIGSGIGLSEVRKIMGQHKGDVKFQSKKLWGEGFEAAFLTTVTLIFPFNDRQ